MHIFGYNISKKIVRAISHAGRGSAALPRPHLLASLGLPSDATALADAGARVLGPHGERTAGTYNRGLGQTPAGSSGRALPGQGDRRRSPLKLNSFLHYHNPKSPPNCPEICFFLNKQFRRKFGGMPSGLPWIRQCATVLIKPYFFNAWRGSMFNTSTIVCKII